MTKQKLDKTTFSKGIAYLTHYYLQDRFKDSLNNEMVLNVWYQAFSDMPNSIYMEAIKVYCNNNSYPPNSPHDIKNARREFLIKNMSDYNSAWLKMLETRNKCVYHLSSDVNINLLLKSVENDTPLYNTIEVLKEDLKYHITPDRLPFIKNEFKAIYEKEVEKVVGEKYFYLENVRPEMLIPAPLDVKELADKEHAGKKTLVEYIYDEAVNHNKKELGFYEDVYVKAYNKCAEENNAKYVIDNDRDIIGFCLNEINKHIDKNETQGTALFRIDVVNNRFLLNKKIKEWLNNEYL